MSAVRIRLVTRDDDIKVDESPLYVPIDLKRYGLSEVVNQLLKTPSPIPFDFLIDGKLLRQSLGDYLATSALSTETVIDVEYVRAILPPNYLASYAHDDWVSAVHIRENSGIATGSYDGVVRVWDRSGKVTRELAGHTAAVKDVRWLGPESLVSASADRTLVVWNRSKPVCVFAGHKAAVTSVRELTAHNRIVSSSQDATLKVWTTQFNELPSYELPVTNNTASQKRRRVAAAQRPDAKLRGSLATLEGHQSSVTAVAAHPTEPEVVYSVSEDHSLRTWDLVTGQLVDTKTTGFSLLSVLPLGSPSGLIAAGSSARHILLVDPRAKTTTSQSQLNGHHNFVVALAKSPKNDYQFASASHDGSVRIWDVRANRAVFVVDREVEVESQDLYCIDWAEDIVAAGGRNKRLEMWQPQH